MVGGKGFSEANPGISEGQERWPNQGPGGARDWRIWPQALGSRLM